MFGRTIIKSKRRFSYEERPGNNHGVVRGDLKAEILLFMDLLRKPGRQVRRGSIAFEKGWRSNFTWMRKVNRPEFILRNRKNPQLIESLCCLLTGSVQHLLENNCRYIQDIREKKSYKEK